jgi:ketosteroid isomerase-like protein
MVTMRIPPRIVYNEQRLKTLRDPNFRRGTVDSFTNDDVKVRVYGGDTAISTGHWKRASRDSEGKDTSASGRFTHIWVKQNGKWLLAGAHYSPDIDFDKLKSTAARNENKKN